MSGFNSRSLSSLRLPPGTLPLLNRNGFYNVEDLSEMSPEQLQKGLTMNSVPICSSEYALLDTGISREYSQAIFSASQAPKRPTLTQSAAAMVDITSEKISTLCSAVDTLLDGGLTRGSILEISGPPGSAKETLAVNVIKSFLKKDRKSTRLNSSHSGESRMPSSA